MSPSAGPTASSAALPMTAIRIRMTVRWRNAGESRASLAETIAPTSRARLAGPDVVKSPGRRERCAGWQDYAAGPYTLTPAGGCRRTTAGPTHDWRSSRAILLSPTVAATASPRNQQCRACCVTADGREGGAARETDAFHGDFPARKTYGGADDAGDSGHVWA